MAIYDYECERCGKVFQQNRPMSESSFSSKCPVCEVECKRIFTAAPGFILKGKGWPGKAIKEKNGNK